MSYIAGTDLTFEIPLVDPNGVGIEATAVEFSVADGEGNVLMANAPLSGFAAGSDATVTVPSTHNTLPVGLIKAAREVTLRCTTAAGIVVVTHTYVIEALSGALVRGVNTMVTLATADMLASEMTGLSAWGSANKSQKINSLIEAYRRLGKVRLLPLSWLDQDEDRPTITRKFVGTSLLDLTVSEVFALEPKVIAALSYAQVAEADSILGGDDTETQRNDGVILETIGEVKKMFRNSKPLELPICRRAMSYLSLYVTLGSKVIGRTS